jgi:hypothetical protein
VGILAFQVIVVTLGCQGIVESQDIAGFRVTVVIQVFLDIAGFRVTVGSLAFQVIVEYQVTLDYPGIVAFQVIQEWEHQVIQEWEHQVILGYRELHPALDIQDCQDIVVIQVY